MTVIGLDHGNGWVKAVSSKKSIVLPSMVARKDALGEEVTSQTLDIKEYESVAEKGSVYIWGKDVTKAESVLSTYGSQNRYLQPLYKLLCEFAIAEVLPDHSHDNVWIVTGVPSSEKGTIAEDQIKSILMGGHIVNINGIQKMITVTNVTILPQPVGTVMSRYLDRDGFVLNDEYETSSVGIIDVGTGTTDLDHIKELRRQEGDFLSVSMGMFDVYKKVAAHIRKQNPSVDVTPQKVEKQFRSDSYVISKRKSEDISDIKERALHDTAMEIKTAITQQWKTWDRFDEIIITGGGAASLGLKLRDLIDDAETVPNSQTANAEGFYRYGIYLKGE